MEFDQLTDEQLAKLTPEQIEILETNPDKLGEFVGEQAETEEKPEQEEQEGAANGAGEEDEPVGVSTKSGKGIIPYEKHKELRVENSTLRQQLQDMQSKLEELQKAKDDATTKKGSDDADKAIDQYLEKIKEEIPDLHTVITGVREENRERSERLEKTIAELKREKEEADRAKEQTVKEQVAEAKDNNPDLSHWEASDPEAWEEALRQDEILRTAAKWSNKPYAERFEEVARRVRAIMPDASAPKKQPDTAETKAKAKAKVETAQVRKPTTLSDIPSAASPASEQEQLANLHPLELARKLASMPAHKAAAMRADLD